MNWMSELQSINYLAVAAAAMTSYILGFAWYHWAVFGEAWANALNITKEEADNTEGLGVAFAMSLVSGLMKALLITLLFAAMNVSGVVSGAVFGAAVAIAFTLTSLSYYNGFARAPSKLTMINSAHSVVELTLIGAVVGAIA